MWDSLGDCRFSIESGSLPDGVLLDAVTGEVTGHPKTRGSFFCRIGVRNGAGQIVREFDYAIHITPAMAPETAIWNGVVTNVDEHR